MQDLTQLEKLTSDTYTTNQKHLKYSLIRHIKLIGLNVDFELFSAVKNLRHFA